MGLLQERDPAHVLIQAVLSGCRQFKHVVWGRGQWWWERGGIGEEDSGIGFDKNILCAGINFSNNENNVVIKQNQWKH